MSGSILELHDGGGQDENKHDTRRAFDGTGSAGELLLLGI